MKLIRVTYRATFRQPLTGPLNAMGCKITCPIFVEVYQATKDRWQARTPKVGEWPSDPWPLPSQINAERMRITVEDAFEAQLTPWEIWGNPGTKMDVSRVLSADEVEIHEDGKVYFKDPPAKEEPKA